ncbi:hypothetical protein EON64_21070, partial [archaeon]
MFPGIRGMIKKAVTRGEDGANYPAGTFRATFEDKVLMSDIVMLKLWVQVEVKNWCTPVLSLLQGAPTKANNDTGDGNGDGDGLMLMRNVAQIRRDEKIPQQIKKDSVYAPIERQARVFAPLRLPTKLQDSLPYASKPKNAGGLVSMKEGLAVRGAVKGKSNSFVTSSLSLQKRGQLAKRLEVGRAGAKGGAMVLEPTERKERGLLTMLRTIEKDKVAKKEERDKAKAVERQKKQKREADKWGDDKREEKKRKYKDDGIKR